MLPPNADETADTTALEEHANAIQDELDAFLALKGAEIQEQVRWRPRPDPPSGSDRLF
ncbi:hypothetical protein AB0L82_35340 [Nocardia sp. NPDC052001]|uniref:hypothetical protein n=1 Tax=Nocardia sp. NPDC052001 TaxID=3154853 RepID=UPI0034315AA0